MPTYDSLAYGRGAPLVGDRARAVFGQVMGLVAVTIGCAALGAYIGRNLTGGTGLLLFIAAFACIFGLQFAAARGREQLATALLFGLGLLLGMAIGPVVAFYAKTNPSVVWQAAGSAGLFVAGCGAFGYATRRDLSAWGRTLFWALVALIGVGLITLFVAVPGGNIIYCLLGLAVFGGLTIFDFNRLRRANMNMAVPIAAGIFLDVFNIFLFFLSLFGGGRRN
jgi:modulator of FtsH protease